LVDLGKRREHDASRSHSIKQDTEITAFGESAPLKRRSLATAALARLQHPQDAPDQVLAVAAARLIAADLLVLPPQLACAAAPPRTQGATTMQQLSEGVDR